MNVATTGTATQNLAQKWALGLQPALKDKAKHPHLISYNSNILGIKSAKVNPMHGKNNLLGHSNLFDKLNKSIIDP